MTAEEITQPAPHQTTQIVEFSKTQSALADLRSRFANVVFDVSTTKGMDEAKVARAEVRGYRTSLEHSRVAVKADALERCRLIDAEAKRITVELESLEDPIDAQIKAQEKKKEDEKQARIAAEEQRVTGIMGRISAIRSAVTIISVMSAPPLPKIAELIASTEAVAIDDSFGEFRQQADDAKTATLAILSQARAAAVDREQEQERIKAERAELAKLREEQALREAAAQAQRDEEERKAKAERQERDRLERDRLAEERRQQAEAQAKIDAENKRLADEREALEREKEAARQEAAAAERKRLAEEAAELKRREDAEAAERKRKADAAAAAKKAKYPGEAAIISALAEHFEVTDAVVRKWLTALKVAA